MIGRPYHAAKCRVRDVARLLRLRLAVIEEGVADAAPAMAFQQDRLAKIEHPRRIVARAAKCIGKCVRVAEQG